ncbi:MAG: hypothetical protein OXG15_11895 [Gammaproteobacteria bacterium]|nr:hypothetical protein [Gammaproteobacteria bacterium]
MDWLIIALLLLVAFGGVAYVLPSKFQRRVSQLRLEARQQGIFTSSRTIPDLDAEAEDRVTSGGKVRQREDLCVVYDLGYPSSVPNPPQWQLVRYKKSNLPIPGWLLRDNHLSGVELSDTNYWTTVASKIADMPKVCRSVLSHESGVSWIGIETKEAVVEGKFLGELTTSLGSLRDLNLSISESNRQGEGTK